MQMQTYINEIRRDGITSDIIKALIIQYETENTEKENLNKRYRGIWSPIFDRKPNVDDDIKDDILNNKICTNFVSLIVDTKTGYLTGKPITYNLNQDEKHDINIEYIKEFNTRTNSADNDMESVKAASTVGYSARLLYINSAGKEDVMMLKPWQVIPLFENEITKLSYALRYYEVDIYEGDGYQTRKKIEFYDDKNIYYFLEDKDGEYAPYDEYIMQENERITQLSIWPHPFNECPVIIFPNNFNADTDCNDSVLTLIDGFDVAFSNVNSELEASRLAILLISGAIIETKDNKDMKRLRYASMINIEEGSAQYLTKNINDSVVEHHLDRLENNIMTMTQTPNMNDENFAGNLSGVAIDNKLLPFENRCIMTERSIERALRQQYKLLCNSWVRRGCTIDYLNIEFVFTRNKPRSLEGDAKVYTMLKGKVSEQLALSLTGLTDQIDEEIKRQEDAYVTLDFEETEKAEKVVDEETEI